MSSTMFQIARYSRPYKFADVIGQNNAVNAVHQALLQNKLLPVCILYGPSGVGKTTIARLIAMWMCCEQRIENEACGLCSQCQNIINGSHPDVFELDGGAYTGIDDIRDMLSNLDYQTVMSSKRIFILDEVHMLSKHAITCLLKRFEEPMDNIQFILATTNIDKLPETIISRSFRIMLSSISTQNISHHLEKICNKYHTKYTIEALQILSKHSHGSMRQALSSLEQMSILYNDDVSSEHVEKMFGLIPTDILSKLIECIVNQDIQAIQSLLLRMTPNASSIMVISQILESIHKLEIPKSNYITNFAYDLAESALVLNKVPFANNLLNTCILRAIYKNITLQSTDKQNQSQKLDDISDDLCKHKKIDPSNDELDLLEEAKHVFNIADIDKTH